MANLWDVEKYRSEHEPDDHWELRKKFMLAHKDRLDENELVCLAQVFTNMEFLGCRYPDQTMKRVAELAKGVVEAFRESRKDRLKRTFVSASDAASSKAKKLPGESVSRTTGTTSSFHVSSTNLTYNDYDMDSNNKDTPRQPVPLKNIVLFDFGSGLKPNDMLTKSFQINKVSYKFKFDQLPSGEHRGVIEIEGSDFCEGIGDSKHKSKEIMCATALEKLRKICYTIVMSSRFDSSSDQKVEPSDIGAQSNSKNDSKADGNPLSDDNVGSKLMRLMGWSGGGLGSEGQGIVEPIVPVAQVPRAGLGVSCPRGKNISPEFTRRVRRYLVNWQTTATTPTEELVFAADFSSEERAEIHRISRQLHLKSRSYGKASSRQLIVWRIFTPMEIVEDLSRAGGKRGKYSLIAPIGPEEVIDLTDL